MLASLPANSSVLFEKSKQNETTDELCFLPCVSREADSPTHTIQLLYRYKTEQGSFTYGELCVLTDEGLYMLQLIEGFVSS